MRGPESHRRRQAYETCLGARTLPTQLIGIAGGIRTRACWPLMPVTLPSWSTATKQFVGMLGLAPSCPMAIALQATSVSQPSTFPWGGRRDSHPLTRGSQPRVSTTSTSTTVRLEGIAPSPLAYQASARAVVLQAVASSRELSGENSPSNGQIRSSGCHTTAARFSEEKRAKQAASELNAATRLWRPSSSQTATHREC